MSFSKSISITFLSATLAFAPMPALSKDKDSAKTAFNTFKTQDTGGSAGNAAATSGGAFGLSTTTLVGIGAALAAIVVATSVTSNPVCPKGMMDCGWPWPPEPTPSTNTSTSTGTGTGN